MTDRGYRNLNNSVLRLLSNALKDDPTVDLKKVLHKACTTLHIQERLKKRLKDKSPAVLFFAIGIKSTLSRCQGGGAVRTRNDIIFLHTFLRRRPCFHRALFTCYLLEFTIYLMYHWTSTIIHRISAGTPIGEGSSRTVVQISNDVVVKVGKDLDHDESGFLKFLAEQVPGVPAPRVLGLITIGSTSYMFMTRIRGTTLEQRWPTLSEEVKKSIRTTLDHILQLLRSVAVLHGAPLGSPCGRRLCKDVRMSTRTGLRSIYDETDFDDFLLTSPSPRASQGYRNWLRSLMRDDHHIDLTHGDFHPRNIVVGDGPDGITTAVNTRAITDPSDWWDHLPETILGCERDVAVDRLLERTGTWRVFAYLVVPC
ncbi:kinase-like protein [Desarmillaria tabescens]|uniref:Kinase-like protein n=1 Tax=Armillaria tabescens TaxID=1929756 RepID=A0AA39TWJ7_ARMTA|nr:kinase-like protein [Desarmillaria tabescens]KAK0461655.1 kinase-like protein [Desarmillaria tabescens]